MSSLLNPQFYVTRRNGDLVPLIALDELPSHVLIRNIPRILTYEQTQRMSCVGFLEKRPGYYALEGPAPPSFRKGKSLHQNVSDGIFDSPIGISSDPQPAASTFDFVPGTFGFRNQSDEHQQRTSHDSGNQPSYPNLAFPFQSLIRPEQTPCRPPNTALNPNLFSTPLHSPHTNPPAPLTSNALALLPNVGQNALTRAIPGKKEYCSYWLRHGECDYAQQGCLYKHEMPTDTATLSRLGLREIPRWYREIHNLPPTSANTGTNGLLNSRWALRSPLSHANTKNGFISNPNWRLSSTSADHADTTNRPQAAGGSNSNNRHVSFSPPTRQFTLPAPPTPPQSPATIPVRTAASSTAPIVSSRLAARSTPNRSRKAGPLANVNSAPASQLTAKVPPNVVKQAKIKSGDPLPTFPALAPIRRARERVVRVEDPAEVDDGELIE